MSISFTENKMYFSKLECSKQKARPFDGIETVFLSKHKQSILLNSNEFFFRKRTMNPVEMGCFKH
jgi:hypothetical protein